MQDAASAGAKAFEEVASNTDDVPFAVVSNDEVFTEHKVEKDGVVLFKKVSFICSVHILQTDYIHKCRLKMSNLKKNMHISI